MDVMAAILACSLYRDEGLVRAIAQSNSRGNPYAVLDATVAADADAPQPPFAHSLSAAIPKVSQIVELGGEPVVGLMQVPASWAEVFHVRVEDLFDPCTNILIGTAKLSELEYDCSRPVRLTHKGVRKRLSDLKLVRPCVARKYAQAIRMPEFELVVLLELEHQSFRRSEPGAISEAPILGPDGTRGGVFFDLSCPTQPRIRAPLTDRPIDIAANGGATAQDLPSRSFTPAMHLETPDPPSARQPGVDVPLQGPAGR